jgi:hypothetical protein
MLTPLVLVALLSLAPAMAQDTQAETACPEGQVETPEGCSQQAWVDDCPPDALCAASEGNQTAEECDADTCDHPVAYGNDTCIECSGPVPDTCMDGAADNKACRDDVYYLGGDGESRGPDDGSCETCRGDDAGQEDAPATDAGKDAPGLASVWLLVGLAAVAGFVRRK